MCTKLGLRHSEWLGWDRDDRDKALWWHIHQAEHAQERAEACGSCGTHPKDWDPEHGGHPAAYVAEIISCRGCAAVEKGQEEFEREQKAKRLLKGSSVVLRRQHRRTT